MVFSTRSTWPGGLIEDGIMTVETKVEEAKIRRVQNALRGKMA